MNISKNGIEDVRTLRLILRKPLQEDLDTVFRIHSDSATHKFSRKGPHKSVDESRVLLNEWMEQWQKYGYGYWKISIQIEPDKVIGFGGITNKELEGEDFPNLYYRLIPEEWGKGYATEMSRAAIDVAFNKLGLSKVIAIVRPGNKPSIHVVERLNMILAKEIIYKGEPGIIIHY